MRTIVFGTVAVVALLAGGLSASADPKPHSELTVGLSFDLVNPWGAAYERGFKATAERLGVKIVELDSQGDVTRQTSNIRDLVGQQVDAIVVLPHNRDTVVPAIREAHDAGIPVIVSNDKIAEAGDPYVTAWVGADHRLTGYLSADLLAEAIGKKGNVVILTGTPGSDSSIQREQGARDALAKYPDIKIIDSQPTDWKREKAQSVTEGLISRYGDTIDGVSTNDDGIALGALSAIDAAVAAGRIPADHIKITSGASFAEGYDTIKKGGAFYGSVLMPPEEAAGRALEAAVQVLDGQEVPKVQFYDTPAFTRANIDQTPRPTF